MSANTSFPSSADTAAARPQSPAAASDDEAFRAQWQAWHAETDLRRRDPHGVHAFTGLIWLAADPRRVPGAPGEWSVQDGEIVVTADAAELLEHDGTPIAGRTVLGPVGTYRLTFPDGEIEVAPRGEHVIARPRRADGPFAAAFTGTGAYDPDPSWRLLGRFVPLQVDRRILVEAATGRFQHELDAVGIVHVEIAGAPYELLAFGWHVPGTVRVPFRDATSGGATYGAGRNVIVALPEEGGDRVTVDFTRAVNLPCSYSDFGTCPLPPAQNTIAAPVEAGELAPTQRVIAGPDGLAIVVDVPASVTARDAI